MKNIIEMLQKIESRKSEIDGRYKSISKERDIVKSLEDELSNLEVSIIELMREEGIKLTEKHFGGKISLGKIDKGNDQNKKQLKKDVINIFNVSHKKVLKASEIASGLKISGTKPMNNLYNLLSYMTKRRLLRRWSKGKYSLKNEGAN